jgi:putative cardiolipin synthase
MAAEVAITFAERIPERAYEVVLNGAGALEWRDRDKRYTREPGAGFMKRLLVALLARLPIEWLL